MFWSLYFVAPFIKRFVVPFNRAPVSSVSWILITVLPNRRPLVQAPAGLTLRVLKVLPS